ncbi:proton channel OtopLc-like [Anopheles aquasalis]|uniref:proton channel OtopLc-like n=1 Tax=Anopheles aquasalis TaxID=42839 RepID=UPI00215B2D62|nr:proton channel OtopLc-like [Anopheles aquasalis]
MLRIPELRVYPPAEDSDTSAGTPRRPISKRSTPGTSRRTTLGSVELLPPLKSISHNVSHSSSRRPSVAGPGRRRSVVLDFFRKQGSRLSLNRRFSELFAGDELRWDSKPLLRHHQQAHAQLATAVSALYAKLLIILGITLPVTELVSRQAPINFHQPFYLYLYGVSIVLCALLHLERYRHPIDATQHPASSSTGDRGGSAHHASFYLRIGAIAFGVGSLVYSALDFGQYFERSHDEGCGGGVLVALIPAFRMLLCVIQMQFIITSGKELGLERYPFTARFGLMHLLATNVCEWLYVLVEEAKQEIDLLPRHGRDQHPTNGTSYLPATDCRPRGHIMRNVVNNTAPFLFPCTIEYSLICALTMYSLWRGIARLTGPGSGGTGNPGGGGGGAPEQGVAGRAANRLSIDCSRAQAGLLAGIVTLVVTLLVLIMHFVLRKQTHHRELQVLAMLEVVVYELTLYSVMLAAVGRAMVSMRDLRVLTQRSGPARVQPPLPLDCHLLLLTQTGIYLYGVFSIIGTYHTYGRALHWAVLSEVLALAQTSLQTLFVLNSWWRRSKGARQNRDKPGRQLVTFLLVANLAAWLVNALVKSHASFRPLVMQFYGAGAWSIIAHVSMPLAIFYRFHSTICLFEIWKNTYKARYQTDAGRGADFSRRPSTIPR